MEQDTASKPQPGIDEQKRHARGDSNLIGGIVLIVIGLLFLANNLIPEFRFGDYWPLILVVIGAGMLWKNRRRAQ